METPSQVRAVAGRRPGHSCAGGIALTGPRTQALESLRPRGRGCGARLRPLLGARRPARLFPVAGATAGVCRERGAVVGGLRARVEDPEAARERPEGAGNGQARPGPRAAWEPTGPAPSCPRAGRAPGCGGEGPRGRCGGSPGPGGPASAPAGWARTGPAAPSERAAGRRGQPGCSEPGARRGRAAPEPAPGGGGVKGGAGGRPVSQPKTPVLDPRAWLPPAARA